MSHKWLEIQHCKMLSTSNKTCQLAALTSKLPCSDLAAQHILLVFMVVLLLRFGSGLCLCSSVVLIVVVPCGCVPCGCVPCDCDRDCRHGPMVVNVVVVFLLMMLGLTLYRSVLWWLLSMLLTCYLMVDRCGGQMTMTQRRWQIWAPVSPLRPSTHWFYLNSSGHRHHRQPQSCPLPLSCPWVPSLAVK